MESFDFMTSSENDHDQFELCNNIAGKYKFLQESLPDIKLSETSAGKEKPSVSSNSVFEDMDLEPPPPGYSEPKNLPIFPSKFSSFTSDEGLDNSLNAIDIPMPENVDYQVNNFIPSFTKLSSFVDIQNKTDNKKFVEKDLPLIDHSKEEEKEIAAEGGTKITDGSKYSPSKMESDDENQDFITVKPKVLGKEQAKKRLMAFSLSKQPSSAMKKQNKVVTKTTKEKPPNPNKSSGIQEQFRATISAIEEEKKKMLQNMPDYLLLELNDLSKSIQPILASSSQLLEKYKNEIGDLNAKASHSKSSSVSKKSNDSSKNIESNKKNVHRSRSRSRSRSKRRKLEKSKRSRSRSRSLSRSTRGRRRRSRSHSKTKSKEEKNYKTEKKGKESAENWKSFKAAGFSVDNESGEWKHLVEESHKRRDEHHRRSRSPREKPDFQPVFNYLKKCSKMMTSLQAKPADPKSEFPVLYSEKTIKYTKTKPTLNWAENPNHATDFYMPKQMLLDNCDQATASILLFLIENKTKIHFEKDDFLEATASKSRSWYPHQDYLLPTFPNPREDFTEGNSHIIKISRGTEEGRDIPSKYDKTDQKQKFENNKKDFIGNAEELHTGNEDNIRDRKKRSKSRERKISLVNDGYLSDDEVVEKDKIKEVVVGDVKVQLDLDLNSVKVRSKWDSDYEGDNSEKEGVSLREEDMDIGTPEEQLEMTSLLKENSSSEGCNLKNKDTEKEDFQDEVKIPEPTNSIASSLTKGHHKNQDCSDAAPTGYLASEYEEFLKMVSFGSNENENVGSEEKFVTDKLSLDSKAQRQRIIKEEKSTEPSEKSIKFEMTDWDRESDHEEKSQIRKVEFDKTDSHGEFLLLHEKKLDSKSKSKKNGSTKKKVEKGKAKKKRNKKSAKAKKKKYEDSSSSESSVDSYDSDSESDSDFVSSKAAKKKKKKKIIKNRKKCKKGTSSDSNSDSENEKPKKKKRKKKKKKNLSSDSEEEIENVLLKQLDFKKQLIMKKIEEIDSISERSTKKNEKESRKKKKGKETSEDSELFEHHVKKGKKKKVESKSEKTKKSRSSGKKGKIGKETSKKRKGSTESDDSDESSFTVKRKKGNKGRKKKRNSSESYDSEVKKEKGIKGQNKIDKLTDAVHFKSFDKSSSKQLEKVKKEIKKDDSSSETDSDDSFSKSKKKNKKKEKKGKAQKKKKENLNKNEKSKCESWKENIPVEETGFKVNESRLAWGGRKLQRKKSRKKATQSKKEGDDWEASSSFEESAQEYKTGDSSWDDDAPTKGATDTAAKENSSTKIEVITKPKGQNSLIAEQDELREKKELFSSEAINKPLSETLKTSLSNFSFNENSFCSFGQELSRDFFLTERSFSNSTRTGEDLEKTVIESRPFQSVNKSNEMKKPAESELYSPGYSDSEMSDSEIGSKNEKVDDGFLFSGKPREDIYDPLNCESEGSLENNEIELSSIPLPCVSDIRLPEETNEFKNIVSPNVQESRHSRPPEVSVIPSVTKSIFTSSDFTPVLASNVSFASLSEDKKTPAKKRIISMKSQPKLKSKAAPVFQDESEEETAETLGKEKLTESTLDEIVDSLKKKVFNDVDPIKLSETDKNNDLDIKERDEMKRWEEEVEGNRNKSKERSGEKGRKERSVSRDRSNSSRTSKERIPSPNRQRGSITPDSKRLILSNEKREIKSDSFEIEPLKGSVDSNELEPAGQAIPVLTGLGATFSDRISWSRSHLPGYSTCNDYSAISGGLVDHAESFDIYPSEDPRFRDFETVEKPVSEKLSHRDEKTKKEKRKSRSRSLSPRKKHRSKTPERRKSPRNRSPRRKSVSPKRRDKSSYSPRRRSPKRKSPRRYRNSRSPDRRRKSRSRSPRRRRGSSLRRSRSASPRKHRSPKRRGDSPRRRDSPPRSFSPRGSISPKKDTHFPHPYPGGLVNRIPVIRTSGEEVDMDLSPSAVQSPRFENPMGFSRHIPDPTVNESELNNTFYSREYMGEFGMNNYAEEVGMNNLITVKNHDVEKTNSPERLSLDQRIELELGVPLTSGSQAQSEPYQMPNQVCQQFQEISPNQFQNSYNCDSTNLNSDNFFQNQNLTLNSEFNNQYYNDINRHQQQLNYGPFPQYPNPQPVQSSVMQVGNIVEVVPTLQHPPPPPPPLPPKPHQIMQVGNVLQVVPSQKGGQNSSLPPPASHNYGPPSTTTPLAPVKTQKATAVVAPSSIVPTPNPEAVINPLIKAIQIEREKRRKEKEKRKAEREARRKARQLRREAKLMSVNEKLKKSVQDEGLMLGQEVEDDELLDSLEPPSPPIPVEIITVSSQGTLPPAGKGILITAGFMPKPPSEKKEVKFADGVLPGEGTSTSGEEDIASPPPKPKLPKEKRYKKKKTKVKKKVKVQIIRQIIQDEDEDDEDDLSPPPPPPGDPPPVFFARFPFVGDAQFPVYQTQTTTTTLTTVQYPAQSF